MFIGADARIRTADLRITNALLYRLSYIGAGGRSIIGKGRNTLKPPEVTAGLPIIIRLLRRWW